jgi:hypothetical protein
MRVVVMLLSMMRMVILVLEFRHLHHKSLMGLAAIHHGVLALVALTIHRVGIERGAGGKRRRSRRRGGIGMVFYSSRGVGSVPDDVSLVSGLDVLL